MKFAQFAKTVLLTTGMTVSSLQALALTGGVATGGGDTFTIDFVKSATQQLYPWLVAHGQSLNPKVNADDFLMAVDPRGIVSIEHVFESCDGSLRGREVDACYNATTDQISLSRTRYPLTMSPAKLGFIAHEIFRKMRLEGDAYEVSRQISILEVPSLRPSPNLEGAAKVRIVKSERKRNAMDTSIVYSGFDEAGRKRMDIFETNSTVPVTKPPFFYYASVTKYRAVVYSVSGASFEGAGSSAEARTLLKDLLRADRCPMTINVSPEGKVLGYKVCGFN